jgi:hypothetical protein
MLWKTLLIYIYLQADIRGLIREPLEVQVVEDLLCKLEALSSNSSLTKNQTKTKLEQNKK